MSLPQRLKSLIAGLMLIPSLSTFADTDLHVFAEEYFTRWTASQAPDATTAQLEAYLDLLAEDVGHTHLPWVTDDARLPDGKAAMREGMAFYLGAHTAYEAELLDVHVFNTSAIAIRYRHKASGIHPESKQAIAYEEVMMELLEMDNGKVGVIRKYDE